MKTPYGDGFDSDYELGMDDSPYMDMFTSRRTRKKSKYHRKQVAHHSRKRARRGSRSRYSARKSSGKVYYARKTGQPYILLSNGRAKFIKGRRHK